MVFVVFSVINSAASLTLSISSKPELLKKFNEFTQ